MFIINPGSGPVEDATPACAAMNILALVSDAMGADGANVAIEAKPAGDEDGRFCFVLRFGERSCEVDMPGLALDKIRYVGGEGQNIWHFPRLYVDGSSWVWKFASNCVRSILRGEDEDES